MNSHPKTEEQKAIANITNYSQATHNEAVCCSAGTVVLGLQDTYLHANIADENFFTLFKNKIQSELKDSKDVTSNEIETAVNYIKSQSEEKDHPDWDFVTLYLSNESEEGKKYNLPIRKILPLVWEATLDDEAYAHHYQGSEQEKLEQSKKDRPNRVLTLLRCLKEIRSICHAGVRHLLVLTLNGTYKNIHIIEEAKVEVLCFLKDKINERFWSAYNRPNLSSEEKKKLESALMDWMNNTNPRRVLELVDPSKSIHADIDKHFKQHGIHPERIKLRELVDDALNYVEFACDPKQYPGLARIHTILKEFEIKKTSQERKDALSAVQEWILKHYQFADEKHTNDIAHFCDVYTLHKDIITNRIILMVTGQMKDKEIDEVDKCCRDYFNQCKPPVFPSVTPEELVKTTARIIANAKQDNMYYQITNFFARWFIALRDYNLTELRLVYALLRQERFKQCVELTDEAMKKLVEENRESKYLNVSPYIINRVFLHAILNKPEEWGQGFYGFFKQVFEFVQKKFNETGGLVESLHKTSYPDQLIAQLKYLGAKHEGKEEKRPEEMLLLPDQFKTAEEWIRIASLVDGVELDGIYTPLAGKVNSVLQTFVTDVNTLMLALKALPQEKQGLFTLSDPSKITAQIKCVNNLVQVLRALPIESLLGASLIKTWVQNIDNLLQVLSALPETSLKQFIESKVGAEIIKKQIQNIHNLFQLLQTLPEVERHLFLMSPLGAEIVKAKTQDVHQLVSVLKFLPEVKRYSFITSPIGAEIVEEKIKDGGQLASVLRVLPEAEQCSFIVSLGDKCNYELIQVLSVLSETSLKQFMESKVGVEIVTTRIQNLEDSFRVWKILPKTARHSFRMLRLGPNKIINSNIKEQIQNANDLCWMLAVLPEEERYSFILRSFDTNKIKKVIQDSNDILQVLQFLPEVRQKDFVTSEFFGKYVVMPCIQSVESLSQIFNSLSESSKQSFMVSESFAKIVIKLIQNGYMLASVLNILPEADRYLFVVSSLGSKIVEARVQTQSDNDVYDLLRVLQALPETRLGQFMGSKIGAELIKKQIQNIYDLIQLLSVLPEASLKQFMESKISAEIVKAQIQGVHELAHTICSLPEEKRCSFITLLSADRIGEVFQRTKHIDEYDLAQVLADIPVEYLPKFMIKNKLQWRESASVSNVFVQQHMTHLLQTYDTTNPSPDYLNGLQKQFKFICKTQHQYVIPTLLKSINKMDEYILMPLRVKRDELKNNPDSVSKIKVEQLKLVIADLKVIVQKAVSSWIASDKMAVDPSYLKQDVIAKIKEYEQKKEIGKHANQIKPYLKAALKWILCAVVTVITVSGAAIVSQRVRDGLLLKTNTQITLRECRNKLTNRMYYQYQ